MIRFAICRGCPLYNKYPKCSACDYKFDIDWYRLRYTWQFFKPMKGFLSIGWKKYG